jgi:hypothetical protein
MTRRTAYIAIAGALLCLVALWFTHNYAVVNEEVWTGMRPEAAYNPLLAARMLMQRMGSKVEQSRDLDRLSGFASSGTLFLTDRSDVTPPVAHALRDWVRSGGHLVIAIEHAVPRETLLHDLGVTVQVRKDSNTAPPEAEAIELPDGSRVRAALPRSPNLHFARERADWWYEVNGVVPMMQLTDGRGRVTIMSSFAPFHNRALGRHEHAELLWHLASENGAPGPVWLVRKLQTQSLPGWLVANALPALAALGILLVVSLWRVMPRFGPLVAASAPDRRSLTEHLAATGRFYSSQGQLAALIKILRQDALDALALRVPETHGEDGAARLKTAARVSGLRPRELLYAFTAAAGTPREFTGAVRILREFRAQLAHGVAGTQKASRLQALRERRALRKRAREERELIAHEANHEGEMHERE